MELEMSKFLDQNGLSLLWGKTRARGVQSPDIDRLRVMDRAEYLALEVKDPRTVYLLRG